MYVSQCAFARNSMSHFIYAKGIYSVSWRVCSSVGAPSGHLFVPRCQQERRRLHQISRKGDSLPEGERERKERVCFVLRLMGVTRWVRERRYWRAAETERCEDKLTEMRVCGGNVWFGMKTMLFRAASLSCAV